jgi:anti-anti-sigma factor
LSLPECAVCASPERERVRVLASGELDLSTVGLLRREVDELLAVGWQDLVVDLREVTFADSAVVHLLLSVSDHVAGRDGTLSIVVEPGPVVELLTLSGVAPQLPLALPAMAR